MAVLNVVEASIEDLQNALTSGSITSVELVARFLRRISTYDCRGLALNSIPILNNALFEQAAKSDDRRASGEKIRPLEGIPYTVKDSYKVRGMVAAAGSPAFEHLISNEDAFLVKIIQDAGGVLIGRTNMPAMACGGMQRGIWGRAENPYNPDYLAAAFASGSSNGSAVSTAASFAAFGLGGETVSSGRSPASNNAIIAYTPSRTFLSNRGSWPLYPTCDVPVPHTRSMKDMLTLLDVITAPDPVAQGDLWREQSSVQLPQPWRDRPASFQDFTSSDSLSGLRIAVPEIFLGGPVPEGAKPVHTSQAVIRLWEKARKNLELLGAEIVMVTDFPPLTAYENGNLLPEGCPKKPADWHATERGALVAHAWNNFLRGFNDSQFPDISAVDTSNIYPDSMRTEPELQRNSVPPASRIRQQRDYS
ncbi:amidase signature domain-containing protein [Colletotrichum godetiae]|uniref:Amidase signature domain-containing protein n=1 Tax=Colletotrichum godetiae TaxID=1209918 RepID=A0AAJ0AG66_9PEZI|nr:amidase signature domain-containing protein [Colletotrichum godetiae]KAK1673309.1 amidase signature domain-containing protein [Colletotrichum godetiae]